MNPVLLDLGVIKIYWYSICIFLAILIGGTLVLREAKKYNYTEDFVLNLFFWDIIVAFIGARLYYVAFNWDYFSANLIDILKVWEGGLAIHGGILFGLIFTLLYSKKYKAKPLCVTDFIVVGLLLGQAIGRWGNFFNGEAHGAITTLANLKNMLIPNFIIEGMNIGGNYYIPTFLFESIWCFIGFIIFLIIRRTKYIKVGQLTSLYFIWYGVGRFFVEGMRTDSLMLANFRMAQIVSVVMVIVGIIMFIILGKGSKFENQYSNTKVETIKF
ncbi:MAG TPA: prolipoprotein diacylglyceryl transferase [Bacilli bacterium]|nr:prolipoprotein diacylglyceryl transferase [Bacilli bacterium]